MVYLYLFSYSYMLNFSVLPDFVLLLTTILRDIFARHLRISGTAWTKHDFEDSEMFFLES